MSPAKVPLLAVLLLLLLTQAPAQFTFPPLPSATDNSKVACRAVYDACMFSFRECIRSAAGDDATRLSCEAHREDICEGTIREGCDVLPEAVKEKSATTLVVVLPEVSTQSATATAIVTVTAIAISTALATATEAMETVVVFVPDKGQGAAANTLAGAVMTVTIRRIATATPTTPTTSTTTSTVRGLILGQRNGGGRVHVRWWFGVVAMSVSMLGAEVAR
ncbi:hypothetical protein BZA05DRAFT_459501 [Tricharina praecox]|uniref:uncharacterized protein n=1 Tax=Tricharina praecox TaxID=43433 RepID=UPI00221F6FB9|nr:uncharacterized protein BZA05DRAFT_459501 [Tricharina praecox]KAI5844924.1 hypothetical protein BZA05DRAFT_459501 [Tricharina praecox]